MVSSIQTILLVDDEPLIRMGTSAMLEDSGFLVLEAANADEARLLITAHSEISVVITDVQMPGSMDGLELASMLASTRTFQYSSLLDGPAFRTHANMAPDICQNPTLQMESRGR